MKGQLETSKKASQKLFRTYIVLKLYFLSSAKQVFEPSKAWLVGTIIITLKLQPPTEEDLTHFAAKPDP